MGTSYFWEITMHFAAAAALAAILSALTAPAAPAQAADGWQTTWYAAPQPSWGADFALPTNVPAALAGQTVREVVRTSVGGMRLRVSFSNRYGSTPLTIGAARIALTAPMPPDSRSAKDAGSARDTADAGGATSATMAGSGRLVTFGGRRSVVIAPGGTATSDPVDFALAPQQRLSVSTWLPKRTPLTTFHWGAQQTGYIVPGNATAATRVEGATQLQGRAFLSAIHVAGPGGGRAADGGGPGSVRGGGLAGGGDRRTRRDAGTIVAFGDSITDGNGSTPDRNRRWPDYLAARVAPQGIGVANAGISGARLLKDQMGVKALDRFQHDVLDLPGARTAVVLLGINDIGWPGSAFAPHDAPATAEQLIAVYRELIARAHAQGVRVIGGTLLPYEGSLQGTPFEGHHTPAKDAVRRQVNEWIRNSGAFDDVADFDAALRDPSHTARLLPAYDSGDHLHPGDAGFEAMAEVVAEVVAGAGARRAAH